jgi:hypothetical protein
VSGPRADLAAAALGGGWFFVLLVPTWTRGWLLARGNDIPWNVAFLALSGVLVARLFRRSIARSDTVLGDLGRAVVLPLAGCVVYLTLWNAREWWPPAGTANLHDSLVVYPWGLVSVLLGFWIVIPYGYLCQRTMRRVLETHESSSAQVGRD